MNLDLSSKVAFVSGSTSGLGLVIAKLLHSEGCHVILNGRDKGSLEKVLAQFHDRVSGIVGDVTSLECCQSIAEQINTNFTKLDVLVCNVGSGSSVPPGEENLFEWHRVLNLNFFSATNLIETTRELISPGGSIVCISSICGSEILGAPLTYSCAKAALNHYVRGMARPLSRENIRINAVAPGNLLFDGSVWDRKLSEDATSVNEMLQKEVALARLGKPEEIASQVVFLCSSVSSFATGEVYVVDGGQVKS